MAGLYLCPHFFLKWYCLPAVRVTVALLWHFHLLISSFVSALFAVNLWSNLPAHLSFSSLLWAVLGNTKQMAWQMTGDSLKAKVEAFRRSYRSRLRKMPSSATSWEDFIVDHWESCPVYCPANSSEQSRFSSLASALSESPFIARACPPLECDELDVQSVISDALEDGLGAAPRLGQVCVITILSFMRKCTSNLRNVLIRISA